MKIYLWTMYYFELKKAELKKLLIEFYLSFKECIDQLYIYMRMTEFCNSVQLLGEGGTNIKIFI